MSGGQEGMTGSMPARRKYTPEGWDAKSKTQGWYKELCINWVRANLWRCSCALPPFGRPDYRVMPGACGDWFGFARVPPHCTHAAGINLRTSCSDADED